MSRAFNKEFRRSITHSMGRFLAIAIISALGCGFYAGLRMTPIDMNLSADMFYDATNMSDLQVIGTLGFEDEDIDALRAIEGVRSVQAARTKDSYAMLGDIKYVVRFNSLDVDSALSSDCSSGKAAESANDSYINRPVLVEGQWPTQPGQCVVAADAVLDIAPQLGDVLRVASDADDETLAYKEYTICGFVRSPLYPMTSNFASSELGSGKVNTYAYVPQGDFSQDSPYSAAYITVSDAMKATYPGEEYSKVVDTVKGRIESMDLQLRTNRLSSVKASAQSELDDARVEFETKRDDAFSQLDEAKQRLDDAQGQLLAAREELIASEESVNAGQHELDASQNLLSENATLLKDKQDELDRGRQEYEKGMASLDQARIEAAHRFEQAQASIDALPPEQRASAQAELDAQRDAAEAQFAQQDAELEYAKAQLDVAQAELGRGKEELELALAQAAAGSAELDEGRRRIESGWNDYYAGYEEYESGKAEYADERSKALREIADAQTELDEAQADIDAIELPDLYVLDRDKNVGAAGRKADAERIDRIAQVFPFIFFLVAALVSLTTMTRMVDEERMLIGTFKALGYSNAKITSKYLLYALAASGIGCVLGIIAFTQFLPLFIMQAYSIIYAIPVAVSPIDAPIALLALTLSVLVTLLATGAAAYSTLRERPASLMLARAPKPGKRILLERISFIWKRMSFTSKVTARNIFRYKRRFLMAIIGIAGCTALLLTGLGLHDGINDIIDKQFGEILHYNLTVRTSDEQSDGDRDAVYDTLRKTSFVGETTSMQTDALLASHANSTDDERVTAVVPHDLEIFGDFVTLRQRVDMTPLKLDDTGAIVSEKLTEQLGVKVGDSIEVYEQNMVGDRTGDAHSVKIAGIAEYYTGQYMYMTPAYYQSCFGKAPAFDSIVCKAEAPLDQRSALSDELLKIPGVDVVTYNDEVIDTYRTMLNTVNAVVIVLIVAAAVLAFVVLYNLTNINIGERYREIATLKVLGFTFHEVNAYIYRETILLTIIGAAIGCVLGVWMSGFVVVTAEVNQMMFGREIHPESFVIAFVLTILFSVIVTAAMRGKLRRIDMVESLKSVD